MALSDCTECWSTPCECGHEFKHATQDYKEKMTKSINGHTIRDVIEWLDKNGYLTDNADRLYIEFIHRND